MCKLLALPCWRCKYYETAGRHCQIIYQPFHILSDIETKTSGEISYSSRTVETLFEDREEKFNGSC